MVEAMRAIVPLIVSDIPVHREICGDAAVFFELGNAEDLQPDWRWIETRKITTCKDRIQRAKTQLPGTIISTA